MRAEEPDLFARSCALEDVLNERRAVLGEDPVVYLTRLGRPLREAVDPGTQLLPFDESDGGCDSGWCTT
ncbi:hypothetical protein AB0F52_47600 [Amycolatopsis sp. NPDC024027]|uniref:hypothetical protein n=1 Tax=Amycolatopsis sp. NPDC024027 TaxID=3154327 RepID=UPI0033D39B2B